MREGADLAELRRLLGGDGLRGPGDDAALVEGGLLLSVDPLVEGRHFEPGTEPIRVGRKLVHRGLSDLAAMGAVPRAILASFCFGPAWTQGRRHDLYEAVAEAALAQAATWVGGDLAAIPGPSVFTVCVVGRMDEGVEPLRRSGLEPGQALYVTGSLGGSVASGHHLDFEPRLAWGRRLARAHRVAAMIDLSDGLALDLARMCEASGGVGAILDAEALPLRGEGEAALAAALHEGEDYELCFALRPGAEAALQADSELGFARDRPIGRVRAEAGLRLRLRDGSLRPIEPEGYEHDLP